MIDPISTVLPQGLPTTTAQGGADADPTAQAFARMLVDELSRSLPEGGLFGGGEGASMWQDLLEEELAASLASSLAASLPHGNGPTDPPTRHARSGTADPQTGGDRVWPTRGRISSRFGMRRHPISGEWRQHDGLDIAAPRGTPIVAALDGVVRSAESRGGYGNVIIIDHGGGVETRYAHCDTLSVRPGERILAGDLIGTVGSTGNSTGAHLHFEVREHGKARDPISWLDSRPQSSQQLPPVVR